MPYRRLFEKKIKTKTEVPFLTEVQQKLSVHQTPKRPKPHLLALKRVFSRVEMKPFKTDVYNK